MIIITNQLTIKLKNTKKTRTQQKILENYASTQKQTQKTTPSIKKYKQQHQKQIKK
ncbi:hypothetical protein K9L97_00020 [Candidatus Woesearchaeota archaeon]|nr:hypothetical protein [Candidatus Woesearchaeota archaeon]